MRISESVYSAPSPRETQKSSSRQSPGGLSFIETQFPVSKMSKESYAERTAKQSQTLTGLGKWWGRKPLVLCRAVILGLLIPATDNPQKDREIFLRLMTMDDDGMLRRKSVTISATELFKRLPPTDRSRYFEAGSNGEKAKLNRGLPIAEKEELQKRVFLSLSYDERLEYCDRAEQVKGPPPVSWAVINAHLGTNASSLPELVAELGMRRFGHVPCIGDSFCGGGSIPFEAARLGCDAYGSDLNPVAALLTWAALNVVGGGEKIADEVQKAQREVYEKVDRQITEWGIEHREPDPTTRRRWRADAYLYCTEATCPECRWRIPLAPSWVIGKGTRTIARLIPDNARKRFDFEIESGVTASQLAAAISGGTSKDSELICPNCKKRTPIKVIRGDGRGSFGDNKSLLRGWENQDLVPRDDDVFGERLYCIRWVDTWTEANKSGDKKVLSQRYYRAPTEADLKREQAVATLLAERFSAWQTKGYIPNRKIEPGAKTDEPIQTRGWTHWHHLFNPRQLLLIGLFASYIDDFDPIPGLALALFVGRLTNWSSRLCNWNNDGANEKTDQSFTNQALNPLSNYGCRTTLSLDTAWLLQLPISKVHGATKIIPCDARETSELADVWITDPPYADAIKYEEIADFFLSWYSGFIKKWLPSWHTDSRRVLAVKGDETGFTTAMVESYRRLVKSTSSEPGFQIVMFTHQDAGVWADLSLILWAAGLRVTAAWCVATETQIGLRQGNYVQGTVVLVLRRNTSDETAFLDEVYQDVEVEVRRQLDCMRDMDDVKDPNFSDTDYQLAAYAAALRVLTAKKIEEIDVAYELTKTRKRGEKSPLEELIERAVKIACDHLVPIGIETQLWKSVTALERLYIKGLELESHGEYRTGVYQELARGFGVDEYKLLLASTKANQTRLKTATEFAQKEMGDSGFGATLVRHALFSALKTAEAESTRDGITWLTTEVKDYGANRQRLIEILEFLGAFRQNASMPHWHKDAEAAGLLAGALRNRQDNV
jgi:putative DNA methylase